jgi:predicted deacylase
MQTDNYFPSDYFAARAAFRARAVGSDEVSRAIRATGPNGEVLNVDGAYLGATSPQRLVLVTSGIHGVEGYAGSALQQLWLAEFAAALPAATGCLLVHALNPFGFAHGRRVNENNVDLNRNALAVFPGPANAGYRLLNDWLNPASPPPRVDDFVWRALPPLWRHGRATLTQAIAAGQYEFPRGLFYGGTAREESLAILEAWFAQPRFASVREVWHFDLHTGLGRYGRYQLLADVPAHSPELAEWVRGFGADVVKSDHASHATHYSANGILAGLVRRAFATARVRTVTVEFGTRGPVAMLRILRAENRLHHHGLGNSRQATRIRAALVEAAAPRDRAWRAAVIADGRAIFTQLRAVLAASQPVA